MNLYSSTFPQKMIVYKLHVHYIELQWLQASMSTTFMRLSSNHLFIMWHHIYIIESYIVRYGLLIGIAAYVIEFTLRGVMAYTVLRVQGLTLFCYINFSWYGTRYVIANSSLFVHFTDWSKITPLWHMWSISECIWQVMLVPSTLTIIWNYLDCIFTMNWIYPNTVIDVLLTILAGSYTWATCWFVKNWKNFR